MITDTDRINYLKAQYGVVEPVGKSITMEGRKLPRLRVRLLQFPMVHTDAEDPFREAIDSAIRRDERIARQPETIFQG